MENERDKKRKCKEETQTEKKEGFCVVWVVQNRVGQEPGQNAGSVDRKERERQNNFNQT